MDHWNEYAYPKITSLAMADEIYQELRMQNQMLEPEYLKVMDKMDEPDREMVERYIASCESLEFRFAQLAYHVGQVQKN